MCQKADFCSRFDVHVTLAGGKGTVQMKELQPMASRSSVSTGDPACEKNCFRPLRTEKDQTRGEILSVFCLYVQEGRYWGDSKYAA